METPLQQDEDRFATTRRSILGAAIATLSLSIAWMALGPGLPSGFARMEPSALWHWAVASHETVAGAQTIIYEPVALVRNVAVALAALVGVALGLERAAALFDRSGANEAAGAAIEASETKLAEQLSGALKMFRSHMDSSRSYSQALSLGQSRLAASRTQEQVRDVVGYLVAENHRMMENNQRYEQQLQAAQTRVASLQSALTQAQDMIDIDGLTGAHTRRHFDDTLAAAVRKANSSGEALSLVIADLDKFKSINDRFGHLVGDEVLKKFAEIASASVRASDMVARYGGEEFAIILPGASVRAAMRTAERIRAALEQKHWAVAEGAEIGTVTASFGVAQLQSRENTRQLIERADAKMYESKNGGRNRVSI